MCIRDRFIAGTTITLTATAESGYVFTGWSGGAVGNSNPCLLYTSRCV